MENRQVTEAQAPQQDDLLKGFVPANSRSRLDQVYCADRAKLLLGCYRRDEASDPDAYIQAITMVLTDYPRSVVEFVTDPRTGIQSREQFKAFPPNSGEVKQACEDDLKRAARMQRPPSKFVKHEYFPPQKYQGSRANVFVGAELPQYQVFVAWSETADPCDWRMGKSHDGSRDGIWVALSEVERGISKSGPFRHAVTDSELRAKYGRAEAEASKGEQS